ncbi:MAG: ATP-binding protein [Armatimonadetes bacterium]|nr:ATP-binding protein [Armatimonadota bacterium]
MTERGEVSLRLPAEPDMVSVARLTFAGLASRLGFDFDGAEDIRTAVTEALSLLLRRAADGAKGTLEVAVIWSPQALEITVRHRGATAGATRDRGETAIAVMVMEALTDSAAIEDWATDCPTVRLTKSRLGG